MRLLPSPSQLSVVSGAQFFRLYGPLLPSTHRTTHLLKCVYGGRLKAGWRGDLTPCARMFTFVSQYNTYIYYNEKYIFIIYYIFIKIYITYNEKKYIYIYCLKTQSCHSIDLEMETASQDRTHLTTGQLWSRQLDWGSHIVNRCPLALGHFCHLSQERAVSGHR